MRLKSNHFTFIIASTGLLLLIPLVAMQFTNEVNWSGFDFLVAGAFFLTLGFTIDVTIQNVKSKALKLGFILGILIFFFLIWLELAVGIFGSPIAGN